MSASMEKIFSEVAQFSKIMGTMHGDFLEIVTRDIDRFLEESQKLHNQMQWQAWTVFAMSTVSASLSVAGALLPKAGQAPTNEFQKWLTAKLPGTDLQAVCKTSGKFINGLNPVANAWFEGRKVGIESKRSLLERVSIQNGQQGKSTCDSQVQQAQNAVLRILDSKSKGG